jgi:hypothetical protein
MFLICIAVCLISCWWVCKAITTCYQINTYDKQVLTPIDKIELAIDALTRHAPIFLSLSLSLSLSLHTYIRMYLQRTCTWSGNIMNSSLYGTLIWNLRTNLIISWVSRLGRGVSVSMMGVAVRAEWGDNLLVIQYLIQGTSDRVLVAAPTTTPPLRHFHHHSTYFYHHSQWQRVTIRLCWNYVAIRQYFN